MQLYRNKENKALGTSVQSTNALYFLDAQMGNDCVHALTSATAPIYSTHKSTTAGAGKYVPQDKFLADCLHTAEEIMQQKRLKPGGVQSKEKTTGSEFGKSEKENWDTAMDVDDADKDKKASPAVGESYAIVEEHPRDLGGGVTCQYHAAAVVAQDGTDNITLEVFGSPNSGRRTAVGKYAVYSTSPRTKQDFHTIWSGTFPNGVTITLEKV